MFYKHAFLVFNLNHEATNSALFFSVEKLNAMTILIEAFGNSRTILNTTASRYSQLTTIDYDHSGQIVSASIQVGFDWLI